MAASRRCRFAITPPAAAATIRRRCRSRLFEFTRRADALLIHEALPTVCYAVARGFTEYAPIMSAAAACYREPEPPKLFTHSLQRHAALCLFATFSVAGFPCKVQPVYLR